MKISFFNIIILSLLISSLELNDNTTKRIYLRYPSINILDFNFWFLLLFNLNNLFFHNFNLLRRHKHEDLLFLLLHNLLYLFLLFPLKHYLNDLNFELKLFTLSTVLRQLWVLAASWNLELVLLIRSRSFYLAGGCVDCQPLRVSFVYLYEVVGDGAILGVVCLGVLLAIPLDCKGASCCPPEQTRSIPRQLSDEILAVGFGL